MAFTQVHYWQMGDSGPPVLLLHGFGVGAHGRARKTQHNVKNLHSDSECDTAYCSARGEAGCYHFEGVMQQLRRDHRVWSLDLVGQGRSWPESQESADGLAYSVDLWTEQVKDFIK